MYTSHIWLMAAALAISVGLDCADAFAPGTVSRPMQADVRFGPGVTLAMGRGDNDADADASSNGGHWPHQRPVAGRRAALLSSLAAAFTITAPRPPPSQAAPPMAVIAEELGYYPVTDRDGNTLYVPARVKRPISRRSASEARPCEQRSLCPMQDARPGLVPCLVQFIARPPPHTTCNPTTPTYDSTTRATRATVV